MEFAQLLTYAFSGHEGYVALAAIDRNDVKKTIIERFYKFPSEVNSIGKFIAEASLTRDVYWCPHLLNERKRTKANAYRYVTLLWADLDECDYNDLLVEPNIVLETSPGRQQAFWKLNDPIFCNDAESINRRIAYAHKNNGADTSGWDLTQLLRIPHTFNFKYDSPAEVRYLHIDIDTTYHPDDFGDYVDVEDIIEVEDSLPPSLDKVQGKDILEKYLFQVSPRAKLLFDEKPKSDYSAALWNLELTLFEGNVPLNDVYVIARDAACNKYARDARAKADLWKEVLKAQKHVENKKPSLSIVKRNTELTPLLSDGDIFDLKKDRTIIDDYIEWGKGVSDAAEQYHQAGIFVILSTLLCGTVYVPTMIGDIYTNMWFMILGDTTLTRKSTAMKLATKIIDELDDAALFATDGTAEGLLSALENRANRPSLFLRDELTGFIESTTKKDYMASMLESLCYLYDGSKVSRMLAKSEIKVNDPRFVFFGGGIKTKMSQIINDNHIRSGFIPRFVIITAESDVTKMKPMGPPSNSDISKRKALIDKLIDIQKHYTKEPSNLTEGRVSLGKQYWRAELTKKAWTLYNHYSTIMLKDAEESLLSKELMSAIMERLSISGLKAAALVAAAENRPEDKLLLDEIDVARAFRFVEEWREHSMFLASNAGQTEMEQLLQRVYNSVRSRPGQSRADIMNMHRLDTKQAENILGTLVQRDLLIFNKKTRQFYPYDHKKAQ